MDNQINIQKQKTLLENFFGKDIFKPKDITERIKTLEDAVAELGDAHAFVAAYKIAERSKETYGADVIAFLRLRIIAAALNQGWQPDWKNSDEYKYYPWFCLYTEDEYNKLDEENKSRCCRLVGCSYYSASAYGSLVYAHASHASSHSGADYGSRLAFKTRELALYAGKQFVETWCDFLF